MSGLFANKGGNAWNILLVPNGIEEFLFTEFNYEICINIMKRHKEGFL